MTKTEIRRKIKNDARLKVAGNWGIATGAWIVPMLILYGMEISMGFIVSIVLIISFVVYGVGKADSFNFETVPTDIFVPFIPVLIISIVLIFVVFAVYMALSLGTADWYYSFSGGDKKPLGYIFSWLKSWKRIVKSLGVLWTLLWRQLLFSVPWCIAAVVFFALGTWQNSYNYVFLGLGCLFYLAFMVSVVILSVRYGFTPYALVDNPSLKSGEAARLSYKVTNGHFWEIVVFYLSFFVWYLPLIAGCIASAAMLIVSNMQISSQLTLIYALIGEMINILAMLIQLGLLLYISPRILTSMSSFARYLLHGYQPENSAINNETKPITPVTMYPEI